ncbi:hypothetical protein [Mycobacterium deserti]|uniref:Uncharacterized protein n=1 Tax=Mycobacterium deserti TaxID=2978347 RepID=A0ABT2MK34_9MYCO|nr:hypothetical protein [Mycobacterium deserti]MCT7661455.1 hypothetical protein [Mycobacterium deserti]
MPSSKLTQIFDIRNVIGALMAIYGVVLTIAGFVPALLRERDKGASNNPVDLYFGTEANWWVGLALLAVAAVFFAWAALRPVKEEVIEEVISDEQSGSASP